MLSFPAPKWAPAPKIQRRAAFSTHVKYGRAASLIIPRLYLSDMYTASDAEELARLGITHIVSMIDEDLSIPDSISDKNRLHIRIADRMDEDILSHLSTTTDFIKSALKGDEDNVILVHCAQGISRSATVVCAYLIAELGMDGGEAIVFTQGKRGIVCPNIGFRSQLDQWATQFEQPAKSKRKTWKWGSGLTEKMRQLRGGRGGDGKA